MGGGGGPEPRAQVHTPPPLAHEERILDVLTEAMAGLGHVGEERTAKLIYLGVTSRLLDNIVSIVVKGPSAAGKSATVERVLRFVPDDALVPLTGMSEHFLAYDERPIKHKILVLFEAVGDERRARHLPDPHAAVGGRDPARHRRGDRRPADRHRAGARGPGRADHDHHPGQPPSRERDAAAVAHDRRLARADEARDPVGRQARPHRKARISTTGTRCSTGSRTGRARSPSRSPSSSPS